MKKNEAQYDLVSFIGRAKIKSFSVLKKSSYRINLYRGKFQE